ncbi:hypothetical protein QBC35DRAFT_492267 [Podospora australis]|uniref:Uncharacterized protein n=1 Tax=Podospora australis TaxID=1536484 RepID=A0AAN7ALF2_9PEZI|nr:hypothetical protein QBC35DRAFT_492267 [Podospora australis]
MAEEATAQPNGGADSIAIELASAAMNVANGGLPDVGMKHAGDAEHAELAEAATPSEPSEPAKLSEPSEPSEPSAPHKPFSWLEPHPLFVIALVGPEEIPFGIQKDFLCARSSFYRKYFETTNEESVESIVKLPNTAVEVFAYFQNFLYSGHVFANLDSLPSYDILIGVWKLGYDLGVDGLCDATLEAMVECRRITGHIPATPLLVQVWKDTPEGSSIRKLLLSWAAEYMRSSESRAEFARSLPQEVLSELVVAMSSLDAAPVIHVRTSGGDLDDADVAIAAATAANALSSGPTLGQRRGADPDAIDSGRPAKKQRGSDASGMNGSSPTLSHPAPSGGRKAKASMQPPSKHAKPGPKRRSSAANLAAHQFSTDQKLNFCADLLSRMLSGPGFWTRVVGPFKDPVDPARDGVPDYFDVVKKPMDLITIKAKMDAREYGDEQEFLADMNQIFTNCYSYWKEKDPMWAACEKLQKSFEDKYSQMNKWIAKMEGDEGR